MQIFSGGLSLCRRFYEQAVRPVLERAHARLPHAAALIGPGSEVLGFDDPMSTDHDWGPRLQLFFAEAAPADLDATLAAELPLQFEGFSTHFTSPDMNDNRTQFMQPARCHPVRHRVTLHTAGQFFEEYLGCGVCPSDIDFLCAGEQKLGTILSANVFHDEIGLREICGRFAYYPRDVWLYVMAAAWSRIAQEEHLMGRAGVAGDELGAALVSARLVRDVMRLCFLIERRYAPYSKWLGSAFQRLDCAGEMAPLLKHVLHAASWQERERWLCEAYERLVEMHNALRVGEPLDSAPTYFFGRPFRVIRAGRLVDALLAAMGDGAMAVLARRAPIGAIDQWCDSIDLSADKGRREAIRRLYQ